MVERSWFVPDLEFQSFALIHFGIRSALSPATQGMRQWNIRVLVQGGQEQYSIAMAHIQFRRRNAAIEPQRAV
jgi:hypothetical protein